MALAAKVRDAIRAGRLPDRLPDRMWGGPGGGAECAICCQVLREDQIEYEVEFRRDGPDGHRAGLDTYHLHLACFRAWESERYHSEAVKPPIRASLPATAPYPMIAADDVQRGKQR